MGSVVLTVLSVAIGLFFILVGTIKLSPMISEDVHKEMRKGFVKFAKVFPLAAVTGFKPSPNMFRQAVGITEVVCGLVLAFIPGRLKQLANLILLIVLGGALYTHHKVGDPIDKSGAAIVFTVLLTIRFLLSLRQRIVFNPVTLLRHLISIYKLEVILLLRSSEKSAAGDKKQK